MKIKIERRLKIDCKLIIMSLKNWASVNTGICKLIKGNKMPEILSAVTKNSGLILPWLCKWKLLS